MKEQDEYLTIDEACERYKTSRRTLFRRIKEGRLPVSRPFKKVLIRLSDLEKMVRKHAA